jgi:hypothetical protein
MEWTFVKGPPELLETAHDVAKLISKLDRNDPHFQLKVANLVKCFGHRIKANENFNATWRTEHFKTVEEFKEFFKERLEKHEAFADSWWNQEGDKIKLKHHYADKRPEHVKDCTSEAKCLCWKI